MVEKCWREQGEKGEMKDQQAKIGKVFLMDRGETQTRFLPRAEPHFILSNVFFTDVDFVTPLCSQVVYEGLVDDIFRIKCGEYE